MSVKRFILLLLAGAVIFIAGVLMGKYILTPPMEIVVVDVDALATLIEKFNAQADEIKKDMATMKEWNEKALTEPPEDELCPTKQKEKK